MLAYPSTALKGITMEEVFVRLDKLTAEVEAGNIGTHELWGGADVGVMLEPLEKPWESFYPEPRWVVSPDALEISWLFFTIYWDVFPGYLNAGNKYEFVGRMANAALRYQAQVDGDEVLEDLLLAVITEARAMASQMDRYGNIPFLDVALGNTIHDDLVQTRRKN